MESGIRAPLILDLDTRCRKWSDSHPGPFAPEGENPQYPLNRRLRTVESPSSRFEGDKNLFPLSGNELRSLVCPARNPVTKRS
jgi:hypothetical protein